MQEFYKNDNSIEIDGKVKTITFFSLSDGDALSRLRFYGPISLINVNVIKGVENGVIYEERAQYGDVVVLQRDFPQEFESYKKIIEIARFEHIPVILDIDDLLFELPENHPDRVGNIFTYSLLPLLKAVIEVDLITVSTEKLKEYLLKFNENVIVLPNLIDERIWNFKLSKIDKIADSPTVIGYMGGHSHIPDLISIEPALIEILNKYNDQIQIQFWGIDPPKGLRKYNNVVFKKPEIWSYQEFATYFYSQEVDIFIAPLVDNLFNRCKSSIKFLEYSCLGVPGIYSDIDPYSNIVINNFNGLLAYTIDEWKNSLIELIENKSLRNKLGQNAQKTIQSDWLLSDKANLWVDVYNKLVEGKFARNISKNKFVDVIGSLSTQINSLRIEDNKLREDFNDLNKINDHLEIQLSQISQSLTQTEILLSESKEKIENLENNLEKSQIEKLNLEGENNNLIKISRKQESELEETRIQLIQKQAIINEIEGSLGYRTLRRYRKIIEKIFPPNSKRRRIYSLINTGLKTIILNGFGFFKNRFSLFIKKSNRKKNNKAQLVGSITNNQITYLSNNESNPFLEIYKIYNSSAVGKNMDYYVPFEKKLEHDNIDSIKLIAFYLPQFHPIPENDEWWGKGFTEWTNVSKAVPQFENHYQPHLPDELGFYDLRVPEVQLRQVELAKNYGIFGFCFYYYWFNGKRLLEKPLDSFINNDNIDFPFCLCWANENWTRRWDGQENDILIAQYYSEKSDKEFIWDIKPYLEHRNYIRINNKPVIIVYRADKLPNPKETAKLWKELGSEIGIGEPYLIAAQTFGFFNDPSSIGFDAAVEFPPHYDIRYPINEITNSVKILNNEFDGIVYDFQDLIDTFNRKNINRSFPLYKTVLPGWDNAPRKPGKGHSYIYSSPDKYQSWLRKAIDFTLKKDNPDERMIFINAWNEWGEGAYLEPDRKYGYAYLEATYEVLRKSVDKNSPNRIIFYGHDAFRAGSQIVLLDLLRWLKHHTDLDVRIVLGDGGVLVKDYEALFPTLVINDLRNRVNSFEFKVELEKFLGENVKLIYANSAVAGKDLPEILEIINVPVITHIHELEKSIQLFAGNEIFSKTIESTTHFISVSNPVRENLINTHQVAKEKISVINPFISLSDDKRKDSEKFLEDLGITNEGNVVFGCGTLDWRKGPDLFLETAKIVNLEMGLTCYFYWIGGNEYQVAEYQKKVRQLNLDDFVNFIGERENPRAYFAHGDLFYLPSREDPFPLVCLEAAEFKLPIICFDRAGGIPEFVEDNCGFVVPFEDVKEAALRIKILLNDEDKRFQLGENARQKLIGKHIDDIAVPEILGLVQKFSGIKPKISIILPTYNHSGYLPSRLDSILNQTFKDYELIILDDNSSDNTKEVLSKYKNHSNVRILYNSSNSGSPFAQWIKGLNLAKSDLIWIAEDDDYCEPNFLERVLSFFVDPKVKFVFTNSHIINENGEITGDYLETDYLKSLSETKWRTDYQCSGEHEINDGLGIKNTVLNISSAVFRKPNFNDDIIEHLKSMRYAGDWYFIVNLIRDGEICYLSKKLNYHRRHSNSVIGDMIANNRTKKFFSEISLVHNFIFSEYNLSENFKDKWEEYLRSQWNDFYPNRPFEEINDFYPYTKYSKFLRS